MKKILLLLCLIISVNLFSANRNSSTYSISGGTEYFEDFYMNFGFSMIRPLQSGTELDLKIALDLKTDENGGEVEPSFNVPLKGNINFLFPVATNLSVVAGPGLTIIGRYKPDEDGYFFGGPNIKLGIRYKIHPSMSLYAEAVESLLLGPPKWINSATEVTLGVNFFI